MRTEKIERISDVTTKPLEANYLSLRFLFEAVGSVKKYLGGQLIDIGCGNQPYRNLLTEARSYVGCDIVQSSLERVDVICNVLDLPFEDRSFDSAFSSQVIEHVEKPQVLCEEAFRLLKPGGYFVLTGPMYWPLHEEPFDFYRFTKHGFQQMLSNAGFEVVEIVPNGGKWAMAGLVLLHALSGTKLFRRPVVTTINRFFAALDTKYFDPVNTSNYVVVGRRPVDERAR